jgi:hypothetical protein
MEKQAPASHGEALIMREPTRQEPVNGTEEWLAPGAR